MSEIIAFILGAASMLLLIALLNGGRRMSDMEDPDQPIDL